MLQLRNIMLLVLLMSITACTVATPTPPEIKKEIVEVEVIKKVYVPQGECTWAKPILLNESTTDILRDNNIDDALEDVTKIYNHNNNYKYYCEDQQPKK